MGTIHLAVAGGLADFRKLLVVKELRQDFSANQRFVEMFLDEAKLAARLNHPNVVQTIEAGQEGDRYFLSMEFLDGQPYSAIWSGANQFPQISLSMRLKILCDALAGLHYAHMLSEYDGTRLHIVHRDVSPQNIFVTYDAQVKVVDFGIAKATVSSSVTTPGMFKGKFGYAAPEQVRGQEVDARTDVFAMGVILWEALTLQRFCDGVVSREAVARRLAGQEPRAAQVNPRVDPRLAAICDRALSVAPDDRYESAEEMRNALEGYLASSRDGVDTKGLQRVLSQKFAAERRVVHQLIDRHLKHGVVVEESAVSPIAIGSEMGNNHATQLADLSNYVRNTNDTVVSAVNLAQAELAAEPPPPARPAKLVPIAVAVAVAVGVGIVVMLWPSAKTPPAQPAPSAALEAPAAQPGADTTGSPPPPAAAAVNPAPTQDLEPPSARAAHPSEAANVAAQPKPAARRAPPARAARPQAPESQPSAAPSSVQVAAPQVAPPSEPAKPAAGADLNTLKRYDSRRAIDTEL